MTFEESITDVGFALVQERRDGSRHYAWRANPYLSFWLLTGSDGNAQLSWEFELGQYLKAKGFSVSAQDELSLLLFPGGEQHGPQEAGWVQASLEAALEHLRSIDLVTGA